jgi:hypothetical protein
MSASDILHQRRRELKTVTSSKFMCHAKLVIVTLSNGKVEEVIHTDQLKFYSVLDDKKPS